MGNYSNTINFHHHEIDNICDAQEWVNAFDLEEDEGYPEKPLEDITKIIEKGHREEWPDEDYLESIFRYIEGYYGSACKPFSFEYGYTQIGDGSSYTYVVSLACIF